MMSSARPSAKCSCSGSLAEVGEGQDGDRGAAGRPRLGRRRVAPGDGRQEAVADARHRRDPVAAVGRGAEQPAERGDLHREVALLDRHAAPAGVEQLGLRQDVAGPSQQLGEQQERRAIAHRHRHALSQTAFRCRGRGRRDRRRDFARACGQATPILRRFGAFRGGLRTFRPAWASLRRPPERGGNDEMEGRMNALDATLVPEAELARTKTEAYAATFRKLAPPAFTNLAEERRHRKERLAGGFRIFAACGFSEGVCGPHHRARPGVPRYLLGQSVRHALRPDPGVRPDPRRRRRRVVEGDRPVNVAAFAIHAAIHEARPEVVAAAHAHSIYGKAWSAVGRVLDPITQDACAFYEDHVFFDDTRVLVTEASEGAELARCARAAQGRDPAQPRAADHGRRGASRRRSGGSSRWSAAARRSSWRSRSGRRCRSTRRMPGRRGGSTARAFAGWFQCQPLWDQVVGEQPDLLR